jgi:type II secretion system protein I
MILKTGNSHLPLGFTHSPETHVCKGVPACRQGRDEWLSGSGFRSTERNPEYQETAAVLRHTQDGSKDGERSRTIRRWSFTFIEVMLAVIILTVGIVAIIRTYIVSLSAFQTAGDYITAISLAEDKMIQIKKNEIENDGLAQSKSKGKFAAPLSDFNWETEIEASDTKRLNTVKVTVFNEKDKPLRNFSLISYVENKENK